MSKAADPFDLQRFVQAQEPIYANVRAELKRGCKTSHWMWFVFPQMRGLGFSDRAIRYGIASLEEAQAYLKHPVLGARLKECTGLILAVPDLSAHEIFGSPDDMKLRSSMTLFSRAAPEERLFQKALDRFFSGEPDEATLRLLTAGGSQ